MIQGFHGFSQSAWGDWTFCGRGFQFEPTITVDTTPNFKPRYRDNVGSVFGFRTRNFGDTISFDTDSVHYHKLYFDKSKMGARTDTLALANSWPDFEFNYNSKVTNERINGTRWYLTINFEPNDNIIAGGIDYSDSTILIIKMPYYSTTDTSRHFIVFDSIPGGNIADTMSIIGALADNRGKTRKLISDTTNEFRITGRMLKLDSSGTTGTKNHSITLSARFVCDSTVSIIGNKFLNQAPYWPGIYKLWVEVTYHKSINVYLDWLRVQTAQLKSIMEGQYDSIARTNFSDIVDSIHSKNPNKNNLPFHNIR